MRALWVLPALHVALSAISGYYYFRHFVKMAGAAAWGQPMPDPPLAQMIFWLFNMPCLLMVNLLSDTLPLSWQPQEYTRVWATQPVTLFMCAVLNTGVWVWLGAQWEEAGDRVSWWRWVLAVFVVGLAAAILFHTRKVDVQMIPFIAWPLLLTAWTVRPAFADAGRSGLDGDPL